MVTARSLALRAVLALALMAVFYVFALSIAAALGYGGAKLLMFVPNLRGKAILVGAAVALVCIVAAAVIAWSIVPRVDRFTAPGPELTRADAPELFAEIRKVAQATGQAEPSHVYLVPEVNAFVAERGGVMGIGSRRVMGIGLPLLELLTVSELRAVLVHEFGHFHGGDTKLGPWIYKTRGAMVRTILNLQRAADGTRSVTDGSVLAWLLDVCQLPFKGFTRLYMRITQAISRQQERSADALACQLVGSGALAGGLKKIHGGALAFDVFFRSEVSPALEAGYLPPIADGFSCFRGSGKLHEAVQRAVAEELSSEEADPYDSHPPLRERVAAAEALAAAVRDEDTREAILLVPDVAALEARLAPFLVEGAALSPIEWKDVPTRVIVPGWRSQQKRVADLLAGMTPAGLPRDLPVLRQLFATFLHAPLEAVEEAPEDTVQSWACSYFGLALSLFLVDRGYAVESEPGEPVLLRHGDDTFAPFKLVSAWLAGEIEPADWYARLAALGLADLDFAQLKPSAPTPASSPWAAGRAE